MAGKRSNTIWTLFIAFIMVSSVLGYTIFGGTEQTTTRYNGYSFVRTSTGWQTKVNKQELSFNFHPSEVEHINISQGIVDLIKNTNMIYLTFDPDQPDLQYIDLSRFEMTDIFFTFLQTYAENAVTKQSSKYDLKILDCTNATSSVPVIHFKQGNETKAYKDDSCIIIQSTDGPGYLKLKDRLIYELLDIIQ